MPTHRHSSCLAILSLFAFVPGLAARVEFNRDIRPIFSDTCFQCHGPDEKQRKAGLRLDLRAEALKPAESGAIAIVPGKPEKSGILSRLLSADEDEIMPPAKLHKPLTARQKELVRQWIAEGAEYQGHWAFIPLARPAVPKMPMLQDRENGRHRDPEISGRPSPHLPKSAFPRLQSHAVDAFILARLRKEGLRPSPEADRETLIRRVTLDLTGLPPSPEEVDAFLNDKDTNAYEKVVDRLLSSPHYGEQMARQWLDFARYADSHGFQTDSSRQMWPWRDWVIRAFNNNLPFDQFTVQQIAGDLLPGATRDQVVATGFNRNHRLNGEGGIIAEEWRIENIIDRVETMSFTWLGLSLNCCRCHDHKYDPFTQRDFYSLFAFFNNVPESGTIQGTSNRSGGNSPPTIDVATTEQEAKLAELIADVKSAQQRVAEAAKSLPKLMAEWEAKVLAQASLERNARAQTDVEPVKSGGRPDDAAVRDLLQTPPAKRSAKQKSDLVKFYRANVASPVRDADGALASAQGAVQSFEKALPTVMVMKEMEQPRDAFLLKRGEYDKPGEKVRMGTPAALPPMPEDAPPNRLGLAMWLVDPRNPLTARVWVNRTWERFFGNGLCKTTENLGSQAEWPSHPELLDWLATEFIRMKWDMKAFQRMLVMSSSYRQSSALTKELIERDPDNRLLARGPRFRLGGEAVRDQALAVSGLLVPFIGGPSVRPYMPDGVWDETSKYGDLRGYKPDTGDGLYRRSLYTIWKRTAAPPTMLLFDAPTREICTVKRSRTNTPLQALALLNEVTFVEAARALAERMMKQAATPERRIAHGYKRATARAIDDASLKTLVKGFNERLAFFRSHADDAGNLITQGASKPDRSLDAAELAAYTTTAGVLLNLDRVVMRD